MPDETLPVISAALNVRALSVRPVPTVEEGSSPPDNSEIRKIAEDVLGAAKLSFAAVAANPDAPVRSGSIEEAFKLGLHAMEQPRRDQITARARDITQVSPAVRRVLFGTAGERDAESHLAAGGFERYDEGISRPAIDRKLLGLDTTVRVPASVLRPTADGLVIPSNLVPSGRITDLESDFETAQQRGIETGVASESALQDIWGVTFESDPFAASEDSDFEEFQTTDKVGFWITRVKCVDETNPEFWGSDEIALAGVTVDEDGDTKQVGEQFIGEGFDDGDAKSYSNWRYTWFNLREGEHWPKTYSVSLILAEKDHGGLESFLNKVWQLIRDKVKQAIEKAVTGALTSYLGPVIAAAIGKAVAWIVDVLIGWIINLFGDDIFPVFSARVTTPSMSARWNYPSGSWGNPSSGVRTAHFYGHGGHYYVQYYWRFFA